MVLWQIMIGGILLVTLTTWAKDALTSLMEGCMNQVTGSSEGSVRHIPSLGAIVEGSGQ